MDRRVITTDDLIRAGSCSEGVRDFCEAHGNIAGGTIEQLEAVATKDEIGRIYMAAELDGNGDGYGDGNGDGNGYGNGYGNGDGNGYGNGYGYGDGNGNGYGYGYGNGDGYGDGYGDGNGGL